MLQIIATLSICGVQTKVKLSGRLKTLFQTGFIARHYVNEFRNKIGLEMSQLWWLQRNGAECWVTISKRISAVSGSKVTKSRSPGSGQWTHTLWIDIIPFLFVHATFRSRDMRCRVWKSRKKWSKIWRFLRPNFFGEAPEISVGHL